MLGSDFMVIRIFFATPLRRQSRRQNATARVVSKSLPFLPAKPAY
jgi:hypothetical protein